MPKTIYVAGYPKSGNTWLTRLLADVLDSPSGGCRPQDDMNEVATEGWGREGDYIVRKGHFRPVENENGPVVPKEHRLAWKRITNEKVVMIYRDPREVLVSGSYYWRRDPIEQWRMMCEGVGSMRVHGPWDVFMLEWLALESKSWFTMISYEDLLDDTFATLYSIFEDLRIEMPDYYQVDAAIQRQSFAAKKQALLDHPHNPKYPAKFHAHFMRKGNKDSWKTELPRSLISEISDYFGYVMEMLGYE